jgi:hypothetical protein
VGEQDRVSLPVRLVFRNKVEAGQSYTNSEYGYTLFNEAGEQLDAQFIVTTELRTIELKGRSTTDSPNLAVDASWLRPGETYHLLGQVRNRPGIVRFKVVE